MVRYRGKERIKRIDTRSLSDKARKTGRSRSMVDKEKEE